MATVFAPHYVTINDHGQVSDVRRYDSAAGTPIAELVGREMQSNKQS